MDGMENCSHGNTDAPARQGRWLPRGSEYSVGEGWTRLVTPAWFEGGEHGSRVGLVYLAGGVRACLVREPAGGA